MAVSPILSPPERELGMLSDKKKVPLQQEFPVLCLAKVDDCVGAVVFHLMHGRDRAVGLGVAMELPCCR